MIRLSGFAARAESALPVLKPAASTAVARPAVAMNSRRRMLSGTIVLPQKSVVSKTPHERSHATPETLLAMYVTLGGNLLQAPTGAGVEKLPGPSCEVLPSEMLAPMHLVVPHQVTYQGVFFR